MNFFIAYGNYLRYCKRAGLVKGEYVTLKEFAAIFKENKASNHANCNYTRNIQGV